MDLSERNPTPTGDVLTESRPGIRLLLQRSRRVAAAGVVLRRGLADGADLVINFFGILETSSDGFTAVMLKLRSNDMPLLTLVTEIDLDGWRLFTGSIAEGLSPATLGLGGAGLWTSLNERIKA